VADFAGRVLGERSNGRDELSVRQRIAVYDGGNAGRTAAKGGGFRIMLTVAYLANQFPCAVEPYVIEEIHELRRRGVRVIPGSVRKPRSGEVLPTRCEPEIVLQSMQAMTLVRAMWLCMRYWERIAPLLWRIVFGGKEGLFKRLKALMHTWLGACYAVLLQRRGADHIHVHHGYFGSWIAMVAARLLDVGFSITLHGSDLLLHGAYLDTKLESCTTCLTVSEYNRRYILQHYPGVDAEKIVVARLGVEICSRRDDLSISQPKPPDSPLSLLAVGRLHAVKDHAFLVQACVRLQRLGMHFECSIAGEGPERANLESLIRESGLQGRITLLGHMTRKSLNLLYERADVVALTSRSEGIPLVLMEAMARGKIVLAPAITGIPELVIAGKTGFLYEAGSLDQFVERLLVIRSLTQAQLRPDKSPHDRVAARQLDWIRHAAHLQVRHNFNRGRNLENFGDLFLQRIGAQTESVPHENFVLQQI
jgi:glycosyltransferase involved in cell wall biosynthesis